LAAATVIYAVFPELPVTPNFITTIVWAMRTD
jgi:hypothetical protein